MELSTYQAMPTRQRTTHQTGQLSVRLFWLYPFLLASIEASTVLLGALPGLLLHAGLLLALTMHSGLERHAPTRRLALVLTLVPLARILGLVLSLSALPPLAWYAVVTLPLLGAAWVVMRQLDMAPHAVGLRLDRWPFQLMLAAGGLGLGALAFLLWQPHPAPLLDHWPLLLLLLPLAAFAEELIFRGLLLHTLQPVLGRWAVPYSAAVFAVLAIGYLSLPAVLYAFALGLLLAQVARWSGSLLGVTLLNASASSTSMLLLPALLHYSAPSSTLLAWSGLSAALAPGLLLGLLALMALGLAVVLLVISYLSTLA